MVWQDHFDGTIQPHLGELLIGRQAGRQVTSTIHMHCPSYINFTLSLVASGAVTGALGLLRSHPPGCLTRRMTCILRDPPVPVASQMRNL
jgi:hypothetical protein